MLTSSEMFTQLGSTIAGVMFVWAMFQQYFPYDLRKYIQQHSRKFVGIVYPYIQIKVHEFSGEHMKRSPAYAAIENYLSANSSKSAKRLKADVVKDSESLVLSMDDQEEVTDEFDGAKLWWVSNKSVAKNPSFSFYPTSEEKRYYTLTFHKTHREAITTSYLRHVMTQGKAIAVKNRQRKLYTNNPSDSWNGYKRTKWSHVVFEHPASFDTLAMDVKKKDDIKKDLVKFSEGKEYYAKIGKAWKRGYLLYGPPGTGKSTMIAAMANFLNYDIYDLELTTVKDNTELRKLLIVTSSKSIIVIEDIDCSLDLTGQRKEEKEDEDEEKEKDPVKKAEKKKKDKESKVTLSGLLNFIDGLWSACGGERLIVFTTNYVDKLDPALIRRGRMDKHIELSYCTFEAFKVLAYNYLNLETHPQFGRIRRLLEETKMTPADVAENLMPKSWDVDEESCLECLIEALETAKEEARKEEEEKKKKAEEEEENKKKAEEEEKAKEVKESGGEEQKQVVAEANGTVSSDKIKVKENGTAAHINGTV